MLLFSIIIPNLNQGQFLERALVSLFSQGVENNYEVIVVDGGSVDHSIEIIKKHERRLAWWCSEKDKGQSEALNKGFKQAKGRFLTWLNADDVMLSGTLKQVKKCVNFYDEKKIPINWISGNVMYIDKNDRVLSCAKGEKWHDFLFHHAPVWVYGPSSFFSKELWEKAGGVEETFRIAMDTDLWLKFKNLGFRYVRINAYFWGFRVHDRSKTRGGELDCIVEHNLEIAEVYKRNSLKVSLAGIWKQRLWRLLTGLYFTDIFDVMRWKGKKITEIQI